MPGWLTLQTKVHNISENTREKKKKKTIQDMADQLNIGGLSLADSQHASGMTGRSTYIPPHMRGGNSGAPPIDAPPPSMMHGDVPNGVWHGHPR